MGSARLPLQQACASAACCHLTHLAPASAPSRSVGNLPANVSEAELRQTINELMVQTGGTAAPGFPITSCKLYQVGVQSWVQQPNPRRACCEVCCSAEGGPPGPAASQAGLGRGAGPTVGACCAASPASAATGGSIPCCLACRLGLGPRRLGLTGCCAGLRALPARHAPPPPRRAARSSCPAAQSYHRPPSPTDALLHTLPVRPTYLARPWLHCTLAPPCTSLQGNGDLLFNHQGGVHGHGPHGNAGSHGGPGDKASRGGEGGGGGGRS